MQVQINNNNKLIYQLITACLSDIKTKKVVKQYKTVLLKGGPDL